MTADRDNLDEWLEQSLRGDFDALTPQQVAALEAALNASPELAARAAAAPPRVELPSPEIALPTQAEWDAVWAKVNARVAVAGVAAAGDAAVAGDAAAAGRLRIHAAATGDGVREAGDAASVHGVRPRIVRLWSSLTAVAACVALVLLWHGLISSPTAAARPPLWTMSPAANTDILELEVYGDAVAAVDFGDGSNGAVVISVYEQPRGAAGA